jgi:ferrochelatase
MAYGTAAGVDDIERYYTDIRGGRPPTPDHLQELKDRYAAIGNVFPLLETTRAQAEGVVERLNADGGPTYRAYLGMKHSAPFIADGVAEMLADGVERVIGIVMAPHWSGMSVETYIERVRQALDEQGGGHVVATFVKHYHEHPAFVDLLCDRVDEALLDLPIDVRDDAAVLFTAHSLPIRTVETDLSFRCKYCDCEESCRYRDGLQETADLVAGRLGLERFAIAWQSAGRTDDPWWGPSVEDVIEDLGSDGVPAVVVCSAGFVADHLETLFDLDIEARDVAERVGVAYARTRMPNADPPFLDVLAQVVREHLVEVRV